MTNCALTNKAILIGMLLLFAHPVNASKEPTRNTGTQFGNAICAKKVALFSKGPKFGTLKETKRKTRITRSGPSTVCKRMGKIAERESFQILGSATSTFGNKWFIIQRNGIAQPQWIAAKYVDVGKDVIPSIKVEEIEETLYETTTPTTAHQCPHQACPVERSYDKEKVVMGFRTAASGYLGVREDKEFVWIPERHLKKVEVTPEIQALMDTYVKPDSGNNRTYQSELQAQSLACEDHPEYQPYPRYGVWRALKAFEIKISPNPNCKITRQVAKGEAIVTLGESKTHYISGVARDNDVQGFYLEKSQFDDQYVQMEVWPNPPSKTAFPEVASYLKERTTYWQSTSFKIKQGATVIKNWLTKYWLLLTVIVVMVLLAIPKTRTPMIAFMQAVLNGIVGVLQAFWQWILLQRASVPFSNWNTMIQDLEMSPQSFFSQVEAAIQEKNMDDLKVSRVVMPEGGFFSPKREYLRVVRNDLCFDICGAPFGNGFFVSWWLGEIPPLLLALMHRIVILSWIARLWEKVFDRETYYLHDTRAMYQSLTHSAVLEVIDEITSDKGLATLANDERKPVMKHFFNQK